MDDQLRDGVDALVPGWERDGLSASLIAITELSKRVAHLNQALEQPLRAELADMGLTYAEFDVLAALRRVGEPYRLKPSELTRSLFLTSGGTSNVLQRLTKAGYVERADNAADARSRWVQLTPEGLHVTMEALKASGAVHEDVMTGIPAPTIRAAADALRELTAVLDRRRR
ncbi:MarR family transcriptional regulator [Actinomadura barringtoniae]|uniref:MarR family transcriptional regulator n=1 Tax=Actinomadura barringtoniae TaxID=1427535 RepID=A0A939P7B1_9ACTN|nr:MarR family transcriptional regulator [Actinomadura barringtoniae]MBO2446848.1 MarR family transcriptional regulator [Actinomadura barringtoniae]